MEFDGTDLFVVFNGTKIAKRGRANTPQAHTWISLEPGFEVHDRNYPLGIVVTKNFRYTQVPAHTCWC